MHLTAKDSRRLVRWCEQHDCGSNSSQYHAFGPAQCRLITFYIFLMCHGSCLFGKRARCHKEKCCKVITDMWWFVPTAATSEKCFKMQGQTCIPTCLPTRWASLTQGVCLAASIIPRHQATLSSELLLQHKIRKFYLEVTS